MSQLEPRIPTTDKKGLERQICSFKTWAQGTRRDVISRVQAHAKQTGRSRVELKWS